MPLCSDPMRRFRLPALFLAALLTSCAALGPYPDPPRVSLAGLQPQEMTLFEQRYRIQLRIHNPNDNAIHIKGLDYALKLNDEEFAYGVSSQSVTVPAWGEALLEVEATSSTLNVIQQIRKMTGKHTDSLRYELNGKLSLSNVPARVPFEYEGSIRLAPEGGPAPVSTP